MANESRLFRLKQVGAAQLFEDEILIPIGLLLVVIQISFQDVFRNVGLGRKFGTEALQPNETLVNYILT